MASSCPWVGHKPKIFKNHFLELSYDLAFKNIGPAPELFFSICKHLQRHCVYCANLALSLLDILDSLILVSFREGLKKVIFITRVGGGQRGSIITFYFFYFFVPNVLKIISRH